MNQPSDFAALDCTDAQRRKIALMLGIWNTVMSDDGTVEEWRVGGSGQFARSRMTRGVKGWMSAARALGLRPWVNQGRVTKG